MAYASPGPLTWLAAAAAGIIGAWAAVAAARAGAWRPIGQSAEPAALALLLVVSPVLEELAFRGGLQQWLERHRFGRRQLLPGIDAAVLLTSLAFALAHFMRTPQLLALLTLLPSLVLGRVQQVYGHLRATISLHAWFNACLFVMA